jgi:hypothetical protein
MCANPQVHLSLICHPLQPASCSVFDASFQGPLGPGSRAYPGQVWAASEGFRSVSFTEALATVHEFFRGTHKRLCILF